jgi:pimeloyl-ACP methyl ester carboxylesterase
LSAAWALRLAVAVAAAGAGLLLLAFLGQRRLLYFPERQEMGAAVRAARRLGLEPWLAEGRFLGWRGAHPSGAARARLVVLHGNAGAAIHRTYLRDAFQAPGLPLPADVYLAEYPGYGPRPGAPSQRALVDAALEAVRAARRDGPGPVVLVGESLGSGVAALAAAEAPAAVDGLLLVTPLASVPAVARRHYGAAPGWLVRDRYATDEALPGYPGPVGFLVAGRDEVVFPDLGLALFEARRGPRRLWLDTGAGHNTVDYDPRLPRWGEMLAFVAGPVQGAATP